MLDFDAERFIIEVEARPPIWNSQIPEYSNKLLKNEAWEELCSVMVPGYKELQDADKEEKCKVLQRKWRNLRDSYIRELNAQKQLKPGSVRHERKQYIFYKQLCFLREVSEKRKVKLNIDDEQDNSRPSTDVAETIISEPTVFHEVKNMKIPQIVPQSKTPSQPVTTFTPSPSVKSKKKSQEQLWATELKVLNDISKCLAQKAQSQEGQEEDEDRLFLLSLLQPMKNVHEDDKLELKSEMVLLIHKWQKARQPLDQSPFATNNPDINKANYFQDSRQSSGQPLSSLQSSNVHPTGLCEISYGGKPLKRKMSPDPYKTKKARTQSNLPEDVATYRTHCPTSDSGLQRNQDIEEGFKEELILEDYGNSGGALEDTLVESESNENSLDKSNMVAQECPSTFEDAPVPFESVNCSGVIQVKQEIIDDEADDLETSHEPESSSTSNVTMSASEPSCRSYSGNTEKTPPPLPGDQNMSATVNKSIQDAGALGYTIPTGVGLTTVVPSQPLMIAATTANYIGVIMTESLPAVTNYNVATTANYNVATSANYNVANTANYNVATTANYNVATTANYNVATSANYNVAAAPTPTCFTSLSSISTSTPAGSSNEASVVTDPPASATNAPGQPPRDEPSPHTSDQEDSEGVFISLKKVPMKRRKKTKQKLLRLVKLITELDLDPDEVCFSVTTK